MQKVTPITFTSLLYGVVIGASFQNIHGFAATQQNVLTLYALLVVFDDYFLYHIKLGKIEKSNARTVAVYWLDIIVLSAWYALSMTVNMNPTYFFIALATFFIPASLWEFCFSGPRIWDRIASASDFGLSIAAAVCAVLVSQSDAPENAYLYVLAGFSAIYLAVRIPTYRDVSRPAPLRKRRRAPRQRAA